MSFGCTSAFPLIFDVEMKWKEFAFSPLLVAIYINTFYSVGEYIFFSRSTFYHNHTVVA